MKPFRFVMACLAGALAHSAAVAVTLPVQQDTSSSAAGTLIAALGKSTSLIVTTSKNALVQFDLTKLPAGVSAQSFRSARLRLYASKVTKPGDLWVSLLTSAWSETNTGAGPVGGPLVGTVLASEVGTKRFLVADVTTAVSAWLGGTDNNGLIIDTPSASLFLSSKEGSSTGYPAELEIDFDPSVSASGAVGIGTSLPFDSLLDVEGDVRINDHTLYLRGGNDRNHGLGWYGGTRLFANVSLDGPAVFGYSGGALGTVQTGSTTNIALRWDNSQNVSMSGNVGIGTTTPTHAKLEISGLAGVNNITGYGYFSKFSTTYPSTATSGTASMYASGVIVAESFLAFSDERIKHVEGRSDAARDLSTLTGIQVTDYTYVDSVAKGAGRQKKVIAQQVEKVYPQAVRRSTDVVPDIYQKAEVKDGWIKLATNLKKGERVRLIGESEEGIHEVMEVRDGAFRTGFRPATEKIFVYGREVNDFLSVDYEAIAMLNVSATQELNRRLEAKVAEFTRLGTEKDAQIKALAADNVELQQRVKDIEERDAARAARLATLEKSLNALVAAKSDSTPARSSGAVAE